MGKGEGRGGAQLGKPVKGASKRQPQKVEVKQNEAATAVKLEDQMTEDYRKLLETAEKQKAILKKMWKQEEANSRLNKQLINNIHRQMLRNEKLHELTKELEITQQNYEREVDRKDAIIQQLIGDLDALEDQFLVAQRAHMQRMHTLLSLHDTSIASLENEFQRDLKALKAEFHAERELIVSHHQELIKQIKAATEIIDEQELAHAEQATTDQKIRRQRIQNKGQDAFNTLRVALDTRIGQLEKNLLELHQQYRGSTQDANKVFEQLHDEDMKTTKTIEREKKRIEALRKELNEVTTAVQRGEIECKQRNSALVSQRDMMLKHCADLKVRMNKLRATETRRLTDLTVMSRDALKANEEKLKRSEKILQLAELSRKLETEREKVVPFYPSSLQHLPEHIRNQLNQTNTPQQQQQQQQQEQKEQNEMLNKQKEEESKLFADEMAAYRANAVDADGKVVDEWGYLENFNKKYNKVLLDKLAIAQEKKRLQKENQDLRAILKQYLDGIAITEDVVDQDNPLLIVNGRVNLVDKLPVRRRPNIKQEASHIVQSYTIQAKQRS